jgi:pimeloyl-ACP methyl ester carboxylesterase
MPTRLSPGSRLPATRCGRPDEEAVLLVHGLGGNRLNWALLMDSLQQRIDEGAAPALDVWAVDLPGFGTAAPVAAGRHEVDAHVQAVIAELEAIGAGSPVHLVGNSMGGYVALRVADLRPDLVRSLLLLAPAMPSRQVAPSARRLVVMAVPRLGEVVAERGRRMSAERYVHWLMSDLVVEPSRIPEWWLEATVVERERRLSDTHATQALLESLRSLIRLIHPVTSDAWQIAARGTAPLLVMVGTNDRLVHVSTAASWEVARPDAMVIRMPRTGHIPMVEHPDFVALMAVEHWRRASADASPRGEQQLAAEQASPA